MYHLYTTSSAQLMELLSYCTFDPPFFLYTAVNPTRTVAVHMSLTNMKFQQATHPWMVNRLAEVRRMIVRSYPIVINTVKGSKGSALSKADCNKPRNEKCKLISNAPSGLPRPYHSKNYRPWAP